MLDLKELINIQIHFSSPLIRSQRKNATSFNYILHLLNNRNRIKKKLCLLGGVDASQWPRAGLLVRALHGLAGGSEGGCLQLRGHGDTSSLAGLGWAPARQVSVAQKRAGRFAAVWRGVKEGGAWEGGWAASSPLQEAASFQVGSTLAEGLGGRMPRACPAQLLERCLPSPGLSVPWH